MVIYIFLLLVKYNYLFYKKLLSDNYIKYTIKKLTFSQKYIDIFNRLWYYNLAVKNAGVAQLVEQLICNQQVGGSSPSTSSIIATGTPVAI